jgi:hypothetical protein
MTEPVTICSKIQFQRHSHGQKKIQASPQPDVPPGRVPRISRLMALAIKFEGLVRRREVSDYAQLARLGHVTRARMTQVMNLLLLAPELQEELLFLPRTQQGRDPVHLKQLQPLAQVVDWRKQRRLWKKLGIRRPSTRPTGQRQSGSQPGRPRAGR